VAISQKDQKEIIDEINAAYNSVSPLIRGFIPPIPDLLRQIPECAYKYTLGEVIDFLQDAHDKKKIP
jgi:hypothetical protein